MTAAVTPGSAELKWSCDERNRKQCRNGHGCHCREITDLLIRLAAKPAEEGTIPVPKSALDWLNGEAPDADGKWFGESIPQSDVTPKRAYWWRSKFRSMIPALASATGEPKHSGTSSIPSFPYVGTGGDRKP